MGPIDVDHLVRRDDTMWEVHEEARARRVAVASGMGHALWRVDRPVRDGATARARIIENLGRLRGLLTSSTERPSDLGGLASLSGAKPPLLRAGVSCRLCRSTESNSVPREVVA